MFPELCEKSQKILNPRIGLWKELGLAATSEVESSLAWVLELQGKVILTPGSVRTELQDTRSVCRELDGTRNCLPTFGVRILKNLGVLP